MTTSLNQTDIVSPVPPEHLPTECATVDEVAQRLGTGAAGGLGDAPGGGPRTATLIRTAAAGSSGRIIKQIGDEFMIVFPTAQAAVRYGLDVRERAQTVCDLPQLRIGAHIGQALYREGDYVGATVNIASRVTAEAGPGQFVVTRQLRGMSEESLPTQFMPLGTRQIKGVAAPQELYLVH